MKKLVLLFVILLSINSFAGIDVKTYIPKSAVQYLPILRAEQIKYWNDHPVPNALAGLIEHESCISLTHSKCWNPKSQLKTQREEGAGFGQVTRAYRINGVLRFDALQEMKDKHSVLKELNWNNIYIRPDLQLAATVLKSQDDFKTLSTIKDPINRLYFADAAYNGGMGGVQNERRACGLRKGCDPQKWFGNVELTCLKSKTPLYGGRSACDINRHHVDDVYNVRANKYKPYFK